MITSREKIKIRKFPLNNLGNVLKVNENLLNTKLFKILCVSFNKEINKNLSFVLKNGITDFSKRSILKYNFFLIPCERTIIFASDVDETLSKNMEDIEWLTFKCDRWILKIKFVLLEASTSVADVTANYLVVLNKLIVVNLITVFLSKLIKCSRVHT